MLFITLILPNLLVGITMFPVLGKRKNTGILADFFRIAIIGVFFKKLKDKGFLLPYFVILTILLAINIYVPNTGEATFAGFFIVTIVVLILPSKGDFNRLH